MWVLGSAPSPLAVQQYPLLLSIQLSIALRCALYRVLVAVGHFDMFVLLPMLSVAMALYFVQYSSWPVCLVGMKMGRSVGWLDTVG